MKRSIVLTAAGAGLALSLGAAPANAAFLSICDNPGSEGGCPAFGPASGSNDPNILFSMNDFEGGFQINGATVQSGLGNPTTAAVDEGAGPSIVAGVGKNDFSGVWIDNGQTTATNSTIFFTEAGLPSGQVSDVLQYTYTTDGTFGHLDGSVLSDGAGSISVAALNAAGIFATGYASEDVPGGFNFSNAFITAGFQSGVPEPAAWTLMLIGLGGLGIALRGARRSAAALT